MTGQLALDFDSHRPRPLVYGKYEGWVINRSTTDGCPWRRDCRPDLCAAWDTLIDALLMGVPYSECGPAFLGVVNDDPYYTGEDVVMAEVDRG